jgi:thiamine pyrophosphokinase
MLVFTAAWAAIPIAISFRWDVVVLHVGALGGRSDRVLHPLVTALWQIPMAGLVASWLIRASQSSGHAEVG